MCTYMLIYIPIQEEVQKTNQRKHRKRNQQKNNSRKHLRTKEHEFKIEKAHGVLCTMVKSNPHQDTLS